MVHYIPTCHPLQASIGPRVTQRGSVHGPTWLLVFYVLMHSGTQEATPSANCKLRNTVTGWGPLRNPWTTRVPPRDVHQRRESTTTPSHRFLVHSYCHEDSKRSQGT